MGFMGGGPAMGGGGAAGAAQAGLPFGGIPPELQAGVDLLLAEEPDRGESDITFPIESDAATIPEIIAELERTRQSERAGRAMDHEREDTFERLRAAGYM